MRRENQRVAGIGAMALAAALVASVASAATSFSNSLTGFSGNSTQPATQTAVALGGAGFQFTSTLGFHEDPPGTPVDPTVELSSAGAAFGNLFGGDGGRNFMRTIASDFGNHSFVAEVTWTTVDVFSQSAYFGLGSAERGFFRIADWGTDFSAVQLFLEIAPADPDITTLKNHNGDAVFGADVDASALESGANRLRLTYDWFTKSATFAMDLNYAGGAFTADLVAPPVSTLSLYGADGWPAEPARVYFGGDDGSTFKDFSVTVTQPGVVFGDFTSDGSITAADWTVLRSNQLGNLSGDTFQQAYFKGDLTVDKANNHADFALFKGLYDAANGVGSFEIMAASVPEPSVFVLVLTVGLFTPAAVRRATLRR